MQLDLPTYPKIWRHIWMLPDEKSGSPLVLIPSHILRRMWTEFGGHLFLILSPEFNSQYEKNSTGKFQFELINHMYLIKSFFLFSDDPRVSSRNLARTTLVHTTEFDIQISENIFLSRLVKLSQSNSEEV